MCTHKPNPEKTGLLRVTAIVTLSSVYSQAQFSGQKLIGVCVLEKHYSPDYPDFILYSLSKPDFVYLYLHLIFLVLVRCHWSDDGGKG